MVLRTLAATLIATGLLTAQGFAQEYKLLATHRTSTMEKEMNEAADAGFRFVTFMGGQTAAVDDEIVAIMARDVNNAQPSGYRYRLLATSMTRTMQKELTEAGQNGYIFRDQTAARSASSGEEVLVVLERDSSAKPREYRLLATLKTATLQKELQEAANDGFKLEGFTVQNDGWGGKEMVAILSRPALPANP